MGKRLRLLVIEDEWLIAEDHVVTLQTGGYQVIGPAACVDDAVRLLNAEPVDAAILDVQLNGENTFALAAELEQRGVPIVIVSGYSDVGFPQSLRMHKNLIKPVDRKSMLAAVAEIAKSIGD